MDMGPPQDYSSTEKNSVLLHASKSESNLCSFSNGEPDTSSNLLSAGATSMKHVSNHNCVQEDMVTSTPAPIPMVQDHSFQTPRRGVLFTKSSGSGSSNSRRLVRTSSEISNSSGRRLNPFDSHLSIDRLHLPSFSPSVFSVVVSPSQEELSNTGKFWSLDQQARLFPTQISDDSPFKQEAATSKLDQEAEQKTQEAIDVYFSQHHLITTPEDVPLITASLHRSVMMDSVGNSPSLTDTAQTGDQNAVMEDKDENVSRMSSNVSYEQGQICRCTQTWLSFPANLPPEVENVLAQYGLLNEEPEDGIAVIAPSANPWGGKRNESNASNSTLRRKLFACMDDKNADFDSDEDSDIDIKNIDNHDNCESTAMIVSPGKVMMTPNAQRIPSPNKSVRITSASVLNTLNIYLELHFCSLSISVDMVSESSLQKKAKYEKYARRILNPFQTILV